MSRHTSPERPVESRARDAPENVAEKQRQGAVGSMVSASVLSVLGALVFAWALREPEYPWLFGLGVLPWLLGIVLFGRALWRYVQR